MAQALLLTGKNDGAQKSSAPGDAELVWAPSFEDPQSAVSDVPLSGSGADGSAGGRPDALPSAGAAALRRHSLASGADSHNERWLQQLLFDHPALLPLDQIEAGSGDAVSLAREVALPREGGSVFLDLLAVTRTGQLVLVECKLWRNPQARREVVAQILEYAALMRRWSFGDLTARLKQQKRWTGQNPIFEIASRHWPDLDEANFVDGVARSLASGGFHLIIAGDGIRSDLQAIAAHPNASASGPARLSLVEIQLWSDSAGNTVVLPVLPLRTEIMEQRVVIDASGRPLQVEDVRSGGKSNGEARSETIEAIIDPDRAAQRERNRAFWDRFITVVRFDHPDQPPLRHGGDNWVRIDLPGPSVWLTVYRSTGKLGLFVPLRGDFGGEMKTAFEAELPELRSESGLDLTITVQMSEPYKGEFGVSRPRAEFAGEDEQLAWLTDCANRMVTLLRSRLSAWQIG